MTDSLGDLLQSQDAANNFTSMSYDKFGHVIGTKDPLGGVSGFSYDQNGALASVTDPLGRQTVMTNDAWSRVVQSVDPKSLATDFAYDPAGNLTQVKDALSGLTGYLYEPGRGEGRLLETVTDANTHATGFAYDVIGRLTAVTNALSLTKSFTYDAKGNLLTVVDQNGHTTSFSYDSLDRLISKTVPANGGDSGGTISYGYDAAGNLTSVTHYNGSKIATSYDALNRATQVIETLPNGRSFTLNYSYDADGNRTGMSTPWGNFVYTYDALNRETSVTNPQNETFKFGYDANGRRVSLGYPNGVQTSYGYDAAGQLLQIVHQKNGTALAFMNYTYDGDGNRTSMATMDGTHSYGYDDLNRLTSAVHPSTSSLPVLNETFSYDAVGNRLSDAQITGYTYNAANELTLNSSFTYVYDNNGNQTSVKSVLTGQTTSYSYDGQNELVSAVMPSGTAAYAYDAMGRRVERTTNTAVGQPIYYVYDNQDIVAMVDGSGGLIALFTHGPNIDEPLEIRQGGGTEYFIHADALGSVVAHSDNTGAVVERIEYEAYGQPVFLDLRSGSPVVESQSFTGDPFALTGLQYDGEANIYNDHERQTYQPTIGCFGQRDPLSTKAQEKKFTYLPHAGPYSYADENPVNRIDPMGLVAAQPGLDGSSEQRAWNYYGGLCQEGDTYACEAQWITTLCFDTSPKNNCVRSCLLKKEPLCATLQCGKHKVYCRKRIHYYCYYQCGKYIPSWEEWWCFLQFPDSNQYFWPPTLPMLPEGGK